MCNATGRNNGGIAGTQSLYFIGVFREIGRKTVFQIFGDIFM
jgi:hypothetical protein